MQHTKYFLQHLLNIFIFITTISYSAITYSAGPTTVSYQGVLEAADGTPSDGVHSMGFTFYDAETGGTSVWSETQASVQVSSGLFTVELGSITPFNATTFNNPVWLGINVNTDGEMSPRTALTAVGYSFASSGQITGDVNAQGDLNATGTLNATTIVRKSCIWTVNIDPAITTDMFCPQGKFVAGVRTDGLGNLVKIYCCGL